MAATETPEKVLKRLRWPLLLTRAGMVAENLTRAFWPLWSLAFVFVGALLLGVHDAIPLEATWGLAAGFAVLGLWFLLRGVLRMRVPTQMEALHRLDLSLPGQPLQALLDSPAIGATDAGSRAIWQAHQARMARRTEGARRVAPDLRIARLDPFGLRYSALLVLAVAVLFGSTARLESVTALGPMSGDGALATGPAWEGWIEPPQYTGKPALYLNDLDSGPLGLPENSRILVRLYGEEGALSLAETVSGRLEADVDGTAVEQSFEITRDGSLDIQGPGGRGWQITMLSDKAPQVAVTGIAETSARGEMTLPFGATDDYGIVGGQAQITLNLEALDRRYGLAVAPEPQEPLVADLPMPITGDRADFDETLIEDYSAHVWAHLPVTTTLSVEDAAGQNGATVAPTMTLPARRFFDPLAAAVVEMRRDLLWSRENGPRVAQLMRAVSHRPEEGVFDRETDYLRFRTVLRRLEAGNRAGLGTETRDEIAEVLWELALRIEDGDLGNALERLRRAQERLSEAIRNGASDAEIAQLMQELRDATQDYMQELARRQQQEGGEGEEQQLSENTQTMTQDQLQAMMDRIQELMEQGRMAEAQQALNELQELLENMQVAQGGQGGQQSPGEQAMEGLADTLREQQGLSDQAFRDLQEQFNPNAGAGQSSENEGFSGGEGRGQSHDGTGQGSGDQGEGQSGRPGEGGLEQSLADQQEALRQELERQRGMMPGRGTPEGDAADEALGRAERAMEGAEEALRQDDLAGAIDQQAEAMDALREGMRNLGEALAQQEQQNPGQQGTAESRSAEGRDPLGRSAGGRGPAGTEEGLLQGEDVYRQARELLDEIRRRAGEGERAEEERNYLKRLLDRF